MINTNNVPKACPGLQFIVRALFNNDCTADSDRPGKGLDFYVGDILQITNSSDANWWQAKLLLSNANNHDSEQTKNQLGIVPSRQRVERKCKSRRRRVNFASSTNDEASTDSLSTKAASADNLSTHSSLCSDSNPDLNTNRKKSLFHIFSKKSKLKKTSINGSSASSKSDLAEVESHSEEVVTPVPSYQAVHQTHLTYTRPVFIQGVAKEMVSSELLRRLPHKFCVCVPHTSRPQRPNETDGEDYHFVADRSQMRRDVDAHLFMEAGEFNGHLYGTKVSSVVAVTTSGRHCLVDCHPRSIQRLLDVNIHPISILIRPSSVEAVMELIPRYNREHASRHLEAALALETELGSQFTAIVATSSLLELHEAILHIISIHSTESAWLPSSEGVE